MERQDLLAERSEARLRFKVKQATAPLLALVVVIAPMRGAHADNSATAEAAAHFEAARLAFDRHNYESARDELLAAYQLDPDPKDLFALGQAEFHLGHYKEAIEYYTRFKATNPPPEQAALAEQAIGAARVKLSTPPEPPRTPPPPPPHRQWDRIDTAVAISGGVAILGGAGLVGLSVHEVDDRTGTLMAYDHRVAEAHTLRTVGIATAAAGALAIGAALLRWRIRLVPSVTIEAAPGRLGIAWEHPM
jgi:tetratricopeptide (TPR) repeat protein